jgi:hypothetical protein
MKRTNSAPAPKTTFPDTHLPALVSKIAALETSNITFLVESIYQELRPHKVKKNAIEAKIKEVGEKCKEKKVWIIKPSVTVCSHKLSCVYQTMLTELIGPPSRPANVNSPQTSIAF